MEISVIEIWREGGSGKMHLSIEGEGRSGEITCIEEEVSRYTSADDKPRIKVTNCCILASRDHLRMSVINALEVTWLNISTIAPIMEIANRPNIVACFGDAILLISKLRSGV